MASRVTLLWDRLAVLVLSLVCLAGAAAAAWWWGGDSGWSARLDTRPVMQQQSESYWPWASAVVGLLLVVLGVRWTLAHLRRQGVHELHLRGSGEAGRLEVVAPRVVAAAADELADTSGVRSARGSVVRDRGQLVARITAVIEPEADLVTVAERADAVSAQLAAVLEREDLRCSVVLRVGSRARQLARVR